jgi:hypothetical protein
MRKSDPLLRRVEGLRDPARVAGVLRSFRFRYDNERDNEHDAALLAALAKLPDNPTPASADAWWRDHRHLMTGYASRQPGGDGE